MSTTRVSRSIDAPIEKVFRTVAEIGEFSQAIPAIVEVEFLSETKRGVGTRFRETRMMGKREASTELEVTEQVDNEYVRIVSDTPGTVWDTVFTVRESSPGTTELEMVMDARARTLLAKLMNPLISKVIRKAIEDDMDAVKAYCEA